MNSSNIYKNKFEQLSRLEEKFSNLYKYYINNLKDEALLAKFKEIYEDEKKHVLMAQGFVKYFSE